MQGSALRHDLDNATVARGREIPVQRAAVRPTHPARDKHLRLVLADDPGPGRIRFGERTPRGDAHVFRQNYAGTARPMLEGRIPARHFSPHGNVEAVAVPANDRLNLLVPRHADVTFAVDAGRVPQ